MKKRNLWAMSLIGLALTACTQDEEINNAINQGNEDGALVTLKIDVAKPETKGSPDATNQQPGTYAENAINNVTVVVKVGSTTKVVTSNAENWNSTDKEITFTAPEGEAEFYVYANKGGEDYSSGWATDTPTEMTSTGDVSEYYGATQGFFMSNKDGKAEVHTINRDTENKVNVDIERAAAKVTVESPATFDNTDFGGTMGSMSFALGNMINKFYLLQQDEYKIPTTDVKYLPENDQTPSNDDWIAVDLGKTASGETTNENYKALTAFTGAYCMENIASTGMQNVTTYIKFQTTFTPGKVLKLETKTEGSGYTVKPTLEANSETASTFYVVLAGDDKNTSNYILKTDLFNGDVEKDGINLNEGRIDGQPITAETPANCYDVTGIDGITKISLPYADGKCYFGPIWFNPNTDGSRSPVYRNDWYHLTVTSVKLPGSPQEPGDGGEIPLNPDADVTVKATVLKWNLVENDIQLQ